MTWAVILDPDIARWSRVLRDFAIVLVGIFILVHETLTVREPNPLLIGAGLVLLGVPPSLRADEWLRGKNGSGKDQK